MNARAEITQLLTDVRRLSNNPGDLRSDNAGSSFTVTNQVLR